MHTKIRVSLVIPAYNEESHLRACLEAVAAQTVRPFEVIVVDNNSTDGTVAIARSFPFVRVVRETRQGIVFARNTGFNAARGDVIGRIDADTHLPPGWVAHVSRLFDESFVSAVTGSIRFYDVPFEPFFSGLELFWRRFVMRHLCRRNQLMLHGANLALRRSDWETVRGHTCANSAFHEDVDLAAHLNLAGKRLAFDESLKVGISARRIDSRFKNHVAYAYANSRTYLAHGLKGRFFMYPIQIFLICAYAPFRLLYRAYNPQTGKLSLSFVRSNRSLQHRLDSSNVPHRM